MSEEAASVNGKGVSMRSMPGTSEDMRDCSAGGLTYTTTTAQIICGEMARTAFCASLDGR